MIKETIREQIDRKLKETYTLLESSPNGNIWVCEEKIDYNSLYEAIIDIHIKRVITNIHSFRGW